MHGGHNVTCAHRDLCACLCVRESMRERPLWLILSSNLSDYLCFIMRNLFVILSFFLLLASCGDSASTDADTVNHGPGVPDPCMIVPARTMNADAPDSVWAADFGQLISCGLLEEFDVNYLVPNLIPETMADAAIAGKDSITYQMLIDRLRRFKQTDNYKLIRSRMHLLDSLRTQPVNLSTLQTDTALLSRLGLKSGEKVVLRKTAGELLKKNPNLSWEALLDSTDARLQHREYEPD